MSITYSSNGLSQFRADPRFTGITGQGQSIVVIDTGIDLDHPGFGSDLNHDGVSDRIVRKDLDFTRDNDGTVQDRIGHGTGTAGVVASIAPGVNIIPIQASLVSDIRNGLNWTVANKDLYNITGVSMSLSDSTNMQDDSSKNIYPQEKMLYTESNNIFNAGINFSVAAGNYYREYQQQPGVQQFASYWQNIPVMNVASNGLITGNVLKDSSQRRLDAIGAPGTGIETFRLNGTTYRTSGTSFSAPFVAGINALLQGVAERYLGRKLTSAETDKILLETGDRLADQTYKQVNVYNAANYVYNMANPNTVDIKLNNLPVEEQYTPYDKNQTIVGKYQTTGSSDSLLNITGNAWLKIDQQININSTTRLKFEFKSVAIGEIQGIGFDTDNILSGSENRHTLQIAGSQRWANKWGAYTNVGQWQSFDIAIGSKFTGAFNNMFFINDQDTINPTANSQFRNVELINV
jgi:subtilisin family serine protease